MQLYYLHIIGPFCPTKLMMTVKKWACK